MGKNKIAITLGIVCFILAMAISIQIKTIKNSTSEIGTIISENSGLRDEVLTWQSNNKKLYKSLEKAEKELEEIRTTAISKDEGSLKLEEELKKTINY